MKGYLQRLLRTATSPAESVRPLTGSIFAAADRGDFNVVQNEELAPLLPASAQYSRASVLPQAWSLFAGQNSQTSESPTKETATGFTQFERSTGDESSADERIIFEPLVRYIERPSSDSADATERKMSPAQEPETALPLRTGRSLTGAESIIKPSNIRRLTVGSPGAALVKTEAPSAGSHVARDQQTDDIQIHIGRIEVTAVHPPAPAAPKVRSKEISLEAYLQRRDGRAR
jgi:hypothetical protein